MENLTPQSVLDLMKIEVKEILENHGLMKKEFVEKIRGFEDLETIREWWDKDIKFGVSFTMIMLGAILSQSKSENFDRKVFEIFSKSISII